MRRNLKSLGANSYFILQLACSSFFLQRNGTHPIQAIGISYMLPSVIKTFLASASQFEIIGSQLPLQIAAIVFKFRSVKNHQGLYP